jgi:hypothetical protein
MAGNAGSLSWRRRVSRRDAMRTVSPRCLLAGAVGFRPLLASSEAAALAVLDAAVAAACGLPRIGRGTLSAGVPPAAPAAGALGTGGTGPGSQGGGGSAGGGGQGGAGVIPAAGLSDSGVVAAREVGDSRLPWRRLVFCMPSLELSTVKRTCVDLAL